MASVQCQIVNPTDADVTVNAKVAKARTVTVLTLDDAAIADWPGWPAADCAIMGYAATTYEQRQIAGFILNNLQRT